MDNTGAASPTLGELFEGRFRITGVLGEGNSSVVYQAQHEIAGISFRDVALKVFNPETGESRYTVTELRRMVELAREMELERASDLAKHVVHVFDGGLAGTDSQTPYLVMELADGGRLSDLIRRSGPSGVSMDVAISCLLQILTPLKWLHSRKPSVPHGDLHPGNVLLSATGDLKLTDFGKSADGRPVSFWGAIEYQAAEQLQGAPPAVSSDIYSVGLLWYEMLIGQNPFRSSRLEDLVQTLHELPGHTERRHVAGDEQYERTVAEYIDAHSRARLEFAPAKVRDHESLRDQSEVADVLLRCLAFAPQERPQDAGALYEELSRFQTPSLSQVALKDAMPSKDGDTGGTLALQPTYQPLTYTLDIEAVQAAAETANATYADGVVGGDSLLYLQSRDQIRIRDTHFAAARADILDTPSAQSAPLQQSRGSEVPRGVIDRVHFTATSPLTVCPGTTFVLDIWAHLEQQRQQVLEQAKQQYDSSDVQSRTKGPVRIARETVLTVRLTLEGLVVDESEDSLYWEGTVGNAGFQVRVPKDVASGSYPGKATIHAGGGQIAKLYFSITVGEKSVPAGSLPLRECRHRTAFASYASSDRDEVLAIVQGIQKALPHLDIYLDVVKLRSGQRWQDELDRVVASRDIFYLFWSAAASKSDWVEREWRCAYEHRGLDYIDPIPIVSPYTVPPPQELGDLHFNDWVLAFKSRHQPAASTTE